MGQTQFFKWNLLLSVLFLMSACERPQEQGSGVVRFNLSNLTKASAGVQSAIQVQSVSSATLDDGNNWGLSDPTSMSEIGCYGVMVSAVTDSDNTGQCIYGSGQTFKFKFLAGLVDANASLSIPDIAYGTHTFYVVGMKKGSQACETIVSGGNITQANY
jgi:hypothetical protein